MHCSTTEEAARRAPDPPTHPPRDPRCTAAAQQGRTAEVRGFGHVDIMMLLHRYGITMFCHIFAIPRHIGDRRGILSMPPLAARRGWCWSPLFCRPEACCVGRAWRGLGGNVTHRRAVPKRGIMIQAKI